MKKSRYAASRQKACRECVAAKAKCDRRPVRCTRCTTRDLACLYPERQIGDGHGRRSHANGAASHSESLSPSQAAAAGTLSHAEDDAASCSLSADSGVLEGELACPINADRISIRWMNAYVPTAPDEAIKTYHPATITFLRQMLKSYAGMAIRGQLPPFVHPAQLETSSPGLAASTPSSSDAIAICLSLARICNTGSDVTLASESAAAAAANAAAPVLMREMDRLYVLVKQWQIQGQGQGQGSPGRPPGGDYLVSLAIFQAYLIYSLILFFHLARQADPFLRQAIVALQEIACTSARHGLVCAPHPCPSRFPSRMAWVVAEAKRRTLYTMYFFDSVLSAHDGLPTYLGVELRGLPAPASKALWQARSATEWTQAYAAYYEAWRGGGRGGPSRPQGNASAAALPRKDTYDFGLCIDELWAPPVGTGAAGIARRRRRVDQWLEGLDEYGTMLYTVTSCTHGE